MTTTPPPESSSRQLERLSDQALLTEFGELVRRDHHHLASLLRHIDLIDRRKLWARQGYSSLFGFLVGRYHMSESTAGKRIGAARLAQRFPVLFTMVARGELHLSAIHCIQAHLTPENHERVLAEAKHKTMRQLEELVARLAPKPDVPTTLRKLPNRPGADPACATPAVATPAPVGSVASAAPAIAGEAHQPPAPAPLPPRRDPHPSPLAPDRYRLQVTINQSTRDKLQQLQDLLAHQLPKGDIATIIERAFDALLVQIHKRKTGLTAKPRARQPRARPPRAFATRGAETQAPETQAPETQAPETQAPETQAPETQAPETQAAETQAAESVPAGDRTRYLEVSVRREVWPRDDGRCGFIGEDGRRCNATRGLQFAHRMPWAKGGADTADNIGLRCPAHNALEADRDYGARFMAHKRKQKSLKVREPIPTSSEPP